MREVDQASVAEDVVAAVADHVGAAAAVELLGLADAGDRARLLIRGIAMLDEVGAKVPCGAVAALTLLLDDPSLLSID